MIWQRDFFMILGSRWGRCQCLGEDISVERERRSSKSFSHRTSFLYTFLERETERERERRRERKKEEKTMHFENLSRKFCSFPFSMGFRTRLEVGTYIYHRCSSRVFDEGVLNANWKEGMIFPVCVCCTPVALKAIAIRNKSSLKRMYAMVRWSDGRALPFDMR